MSGSTGSILSQLDPQTIAGLQQFLRLIMAQSQQPFTRGMGAMPQASTAPVGQGPLQSVQGVPQPEASLPGRPMVGGPRAPMPNYLSMPTPRGV